MKFIDASTKQVNWKNRNYFFAGTILVILVNIILFATLGSGWCFEYRDTTAQWTDFSFVNFISVMFAAFSHADWGHVLLNMLSFAFVGFYTERKYGTFGLLMFVLIFSFTAPAIASHIRGNIYHHGFSGINYAFYAFVLIDFILTFFDKNKKMSEIIVGIIIVVAIYVNISFTSVNDTLIFKAWPYDLVHNMAHYGGFFLGLIFGIIFHFFHKPDKNE